MFGTLLPKNDMKIADPPSPKPRIAVENPCSCPKNLTTTESFPLLSIGGRYADINYQLRRPDVLANKAG